MTKTCIWLLALWMGMGTVALAQDGSAADRTQMRAEMVKKQAEKLAKDFDLTGETKTNFVALYGQYQNDLMRKPSGTFRQKREAEGDDEKKELTDEEATKRVDAFFAQQEEMIVQMQKRLEVQKQYRAEFAKILTPQQLAKVFSRSNGEGRMRNGSNGGSQWNGNRPNMPRPGGF